MNHGNQKKRPYTTPALKRFGPVAAVTRGDTGGSLADVSMMKMASTG
jgi:hypothetical protein